MLFQNDDPLAVHTVAMAGFRIPRDLAENRDLNHIVDVLIRPGREREFWREINGRANFLKHANRDPHDPLEPFEEQANDFLLLIASTYFQLLGKPQTVEMWVLWAWICSIHPNLLSEDVTPEMRLVLHRSSDMQRLPRVQQLAIGLRTLELALAQPDLVREFGSA